MMSVLWLFVICTSRNSASMPWATLISRSPAARTGWGGAPTIVARTARMVARDWKVLRIKALLHSLEWSALAAKVRIEPEERADGMSREKGCQGGEREAHLLNHLIRPQQQRLRNRDHDDRNRLGHLLGRQRRRRRPDDHDMHLEPDQLGDQLSVKLCPPVSVSVFDGATLD